MAAAQGILTARGGMTCVSGSTFLLTPEGFCRAAELFTAIEQGVQPFILAFDHRTLQSRWRRVMAAGRRRTDAIQIDVSQTGRAAGNTLELTMDHKMITIQARQLLKKRLDACLTDHDFLCLVDRIPQSLSRAELPEVDPYLVGAILTDGCVRRWGTKGSVTFTQKAVASKAAMIAAVQATFEQSFGYPMAYTRERINRSVLRGRAIVGSANDYICFRREPADLLAQISASLVPWVLSQDEPGLLRFLAGVADGDGTYRAGRLGLYIGKESLLQGVVVACLRLGIAPQVTQNRTIANVQIVERLADILEYAHRLHGGVPERKYGTKHFSTSALFRDIVKMVDRQGRLGSAIERNVLYGRASIMEAVLPRCPRGIRREVERVIDSDLRMARVTQVRGAVAAHVYNFEVLAEDELDKNFVAFTDRYSPVLVSNSHAAVVGRGMGKCCVVGCSEIVVREHEGRFEVGGSVIKEGDFISLNGTTGEVMPGQVPLVQPQLTGSFKQVLGWADRVRRLGVRANGDTPQDARVAREFGAQGIGLCRTEHMFFGEERLPSVREMIVAKDVAARKKALAKLLPFQKQDFIEIFKVMEGLPVTIRLLDPPLHEFLPHTPDDVSRVSKQLGIPEGALQDTVERLREVNPMLGHRGCRLGITYPEINEMQARAIFEAACELVKAGVDVLPEVMVPLVGHSQEFHVTKQVIDQVAQETMRRYKVTVSYTVGTMIEVPRAALVAETIAKEAEFFSFGTNDLTQMTFGFSRDDIGKFLPHYLDAGILEVDPFVKLDQVGVGSLIRLAVEKGRSARKALKVGICGEHGGEPSSIEFCHRAGLDYVSCSPYRVPVARLAAAHAVLRDHKK
ncbi:MAG: pyruvate, phosphate dikinase [Candidatus Omnitrophica bacterium]|nr:pyruvate, phosphate dikinase [Candidatus Omnitrophota bacterium]